MAEDFEKNFNLEEESTEPTLDDLVNACREILDEESLDELAQMDFDEALDNSFTLLIDAGIDDPEEFLITKGILEPHG